MAFEHDFGKKKEDEKKLENIGICFRGILVSQNVLSQGEMKVTFELPQTEVEQAAFSGLLKCRGRLLQVAVIALPKGATINQLLPDEEGGVNEK